MGGGGGGGTIYSRITRIINKTENSQEELSPARLHLVPATLDDPLVVAVFTVEGSVLQRFQFQGESWPQLPQPRFSRLGIELVPARSHILYVDFFQVCTGASQSNFCYSPVMSEEYVISLIVKRHGSPALKLWLVVEQRSQHSADGQT